MNCRHRNVISQIKTQLCKIHQLMDTTTTTPRNIRLDAAGSNSSKIDIFI